MQKYEISVTPQNFLLSAGIIDFFDNFFVSSKFLCNFASSFQRKRQDILKRRCNSVLSAAN